MSSPAADTTNVSAARREHRASACCADDGSERLSIARGEPLPLGLHECCDGVNLAVFSRHAVRMSLLLYEGRTAPPTVVALDPRRHRSGDMWHARVTGNVGGVLYVLHADGPGNPTEGAQRSHAQPTCTTGSRRSKRRRRTSPSFRRRPPT